MEANYSKRRTAESFFINQRAAKANTLNRTDGANMPGVYGMLMEQFLCYIFDRPHATQYTLYNTFGRCNNFSVILHGVITNVVYFLVVTS